MVQTIPDFIPGHDGGLSQAANATFFTVLETLLRAGVTTVAEAAFQDRLWRPGLEPPATEVDTTDGYRPDLHDLMAFLAQ